MFDKCLSNLKVVGSSRELLQAIYHFLVVVNGSESSLLINVKIQM